MEEKKPPDKKEKDEERKIEELTQIGGIGKKVAADLLKLGIDVERIIDADEDTLAGHVRPHPQRAL